MFFKLFWYANIKNKKYILFKYTLSKKLKKLLSQFKF